MCTFIYGMLLGGVCVIVGYIVGEILAGKGGPL